MSARARKPTDKLGTEVLRPADPHASRADSPVGNERSEVAGGGTRPVEIFEQDTEVGPRSRFAPVEQATPTHVDGPPAVPAAAVPLARGAERSEPIRVISMKDQAEPARRRSEEMHAPLHVQLRSIAEVSRRRHDTPVGLGNLAPPRDPREARARRLRANVLWACVAILLAGAISLAIWLVAGR
jgi:hypothetical protein